MCNAIPVGALLILLLAGLTLLRFARTASPNAALLTCALSAIARSDGHDAPLAKDAPHDPADRLPRLTCAG